MITDLSLQEIKKEWHGTLRSYIIGFLASTLLTAVAFLLVMIRPLSEQILMYAIIGLAIAQAIIQLLFFLHLGQEEAKPRWETIVFCFMAVVLLIIVIGSLWIISDLNNRVMSNNWEMSHD